MGLNKYLFRSAVAIITRRYILVLHRCDSRTSGNKHKKSRSQRNSKRMWRTVRSKNDVKCFALEPLSQLQSSLPSAFIMSRGWRGCTTSFGHHRFQAFGHAAALAGSQKAKCQSPSIRHNSYPQWRYGLRNICKFNKFVT